MKKITFALTLVAVLAGCEKPAKAPLKDLTAEQVLDIIETLPCAIPEAKQTCEFDKNAVDFGGSVYWSRLPMGAEYIGDMGDLYQWGSLDSNEKVISQWVFYDEDKEKHVSDLYDSFTELPAEYDAAVQKIGHGWRYPTLKEFAELQSSISSKFTKYNDIEGIVIFNEKTAIFVKGYGGDTKKNAYFWLADKPNNNYTATNFYFLSSDYVSSGPTHGFQQNCILPVKSK